MSNDAGQFVYDLVLRRFSQLRESPPYETDKHRITIPWVEGSCIMDIIWYAHSLEILPANPYTDIMTVPDQRSFECGFVQPMNTEEVDPEFAARACCHVIEQLMSSGWQRLPKMRPKVPCTDLNGPMFVHCDFDVDVIDSLEKCRSFCYECKPVTKIWRCEKQLDGEEPFVYLQICDWEKIDEWYPLFLSSASVRNVPKPFPIQPGDRYWIISDGKTVEAKITHVWRDVCEFVHSLGSGSLFCYQFTHDKRLPPLDR